MVSEEFEHVNNSSVDVIDSVDYDGCHQIRRRLRVFTMQTQAFLSSSSDQPESVGVELSLKLHTYPKPDREPVKILIIGSRPAINAIVHTLHQLRFAEVFEWTDFIDIQNPDQPIKARPGETMKALVKYLPKG
jgi:hypothetical protein